uniref:Uncharacterized protein n=1 Tax=Podoviridae sp. ctuQh21 TaxID=2825284 RepID=A0A8S5PFZ5_9CAUD|nr:MAG TPA: hypothetical protein [Podoviridae sp. ctuQh21]
MRLILFSSHILFFYFLKIQISIQTSYTIPCDPLIPLQYDLHILWIQFNV